MPTLCHTCFEALMRRAAALLALALPIVLASCDDPVGPDVERQDTPFYYYEDERIALRVHPAVLTVQLEPRDPPDTASIREVLVRHRMPPVSMEPMHDPGHWRVNLPGGLPGTRVEAAARALRLEEGVRFASAAYRVADTDCELFLVNRLVVRFRPDADAAAIAQLNTATGVRNEQATSWGPRTYAYPARMEATPLELAAHYHRQRVVEWAEPDRYDGCMRIGVGLSR